MNQKSKTILFVVLFAVLMAGAFLVYSALGDSEIATENLRPTSNNEGLESAPDFLMLDWDGTEISLSDFFGKPIVLNFWATWCPNCTRTLPYFEELYLEHGENVHVINLNLLDGQRETRSRVEQLMEDMGYSFPVYFDTTGVASAAYRIRFIPITFFINADGYIVTTISGASTPQTLEEALSMIL